MFERLRPTSPLVYGYFMQFLSASMSATNFPRRQSRLISKLMAGVILALASSHIPVQAYLITLDVGVTNECFHEKVPIGTKLGFSFEVVEGGFYDVDVDIKDPSGAVVHEDHKSSDGKFTIEANLDGPYHFCFHNRMVSNAPKVVIFDIEQLTPKGADSTATGSSTAESADDNTGEDGESKKLMNMINQLMMSTISTRHDVRYLMARDRVHRKVNEKTNRTIVWWSGIEFILLLSVTVGQVIYLKRFFEVRRKV